MGLTAASTVLAAHSAEQAYDEKKGAKRDMKKAKKKEAIENQRTSDMRVAMGTKTRQRQSAERRVALERVAATRPRHRSSLG